MAVTRDIVQAHIRPRIVMRRLLAIGTREDRALAMLMGACFVMFIARWPYLSRQSHIEGTDLSYLLQNNLFALIFLLPLFAYGIAAISHLIAKMFGGESDFYGARLALFWSLLASTPLLMLAGLTKGFIGVGIENTIVGCLWFISFLWIWGSSLREAECP